MKINLFKAARLLVACLLTVAAGVDAAPTFTPNNQPTGWVGEVEVSSFNFSSGTQMIFKPDFIKGQWTGNIYKYPVDAEGTILFSAERYDGGLAQNVDAQAAAGSRQIVTMNGGTKVPFLYDSLNTTQQTALGGDGKGGDGRPAVDFIRGGKADEDPLGLKYRARKSVLGDIVHSRPAYAPHPTAPRLYVGANDGMLHAFDANTGDEVFAYIPSFFISPVATSNFSHIKALTVNPYVHNYYVDASPNVTTIKVSGVNKTILVGGAGAGGKGLYALDVSDPGAETEATAASRILWEITPSTINNAATTATTGYPNLGHTYGIPLIVTLNDGTPAAIVGNGYNNQGTGYSAVLYIINLMTGAKIAGITATVAGTTSASPNGLSSPTAVDVDRDGKVDYVYAGDINGNLWKFDIRNPASGTATLLYTTSPAQPITGRPSVSLHPSGGYMINFGTGRMFTSTDYADSTTVYYAYGIWDNGTPITDQTKIVSQALTVKSWSAGAFNYSVRVSSSNPVDYTAGTGQKQGWKLSLPAGGRIVGDGGVVTNQRYIFSSYNPTVVHAAVGGVTQPQGESWLNEVEYTTGGGGAAPIFDLDANMRLDDDDRVKDSGGTLAQAGPSGIPVSRYIAAGVISQPLVAMLKVMSQTYFNTNPDATVSVAPPGDPGVSGGHFDFDIYSPNCTVGSDSKGGYNCSKNTHVHEYDDKYNVTGVNMLAPSLSAFNLVNPIPGTGTKFKILMANQKLSPAAKFEYGGLAPIPVTNFQTSAGMTMASQTTYWRNASAQAPIAYPITSLILALPLDAFQSKDWTGTGDVRAGLVPSQTGCVRGNQGAIIGQTGPWMNGALTIQIVKDTTPDSAVEYSVAGDPSYGYRLKKDATSQGYQLAQYTMFWHHPNGKCYGDAGWVKNPPQDPNGSDAAAATPAVGAQDPKGGQFGTAGGSASGGGQGSGGSNSGSSSTIVYTFADGSSVTQTTTKNSDGSITIDRVYSNGTTQSFTIPPTTGGLQADTRVKTGRVSWREMIKP